MNNPLKYTDESGELFGTILGLSSDLVNNIFVRTFKGEQWDWTQTTWGWEIDKGLFITDPNKSNDERFFEFISRITWQLPQTLVGDLYVSSINALGKVNNVTHNYGVTAVDKGSGGAVTLGCYSAGPKGYTANWRDHTFVHEYGHYIQSQRYGIAFIPSIGLPSLLSAGLYKIDPSKFKHKTRRFEVEANILGADYFFTHYSFSPILEPEYLFDKQAFFTGDTSLYENPRTHYYYDASFPDKYDFHWSDILIYTASYFLTYALSLFFL